MASISFPPLIPPSVALLPEVAPVLPAAPAAAIDAALEPLPFSQPQAGAVPAAAPAPDALAAGAAMRPDQIIMARQLTYPAADGAGLANAWRGMLRSYTTQLIAREQQARAGHMPAAVLLATQDGRVQRGIDTSSAIPGDAWRFTVHPRGPQEQYMSMVTADPDHQGDRRRRGRAALRLELKLADGTRVTIQAEPLPGGVALDICASDPRALARLREMQPVVELAVGRAGVRVLRWRYRDALPAPQLHARPPSADAVDALSLPVFHAVAELALLFSGLDHADR